MTAATGAPPDGFCTACLSGRYPVPVPVTIADSKQVLEGPGGATGPEPVLPVGDPRPA